MTPTSTLPRCSNCGLCIMRKRPFTTPLDGGGVSLQCSEQCMVAANTEEWRKIAMAGRLKAARKEMKRLGILTPMERAA